MRKLAMSLGLLACACRPTLVDRPVEILTAGARPDEALPVVIALHGYGGSPEHLAAIFDGFPVRARVLLPRGKKRAGKGWGWFDFAISTRPLSDEMAGEIAAASETALRDVAVRMHGRPSCGRPIVVGYSQGGFLAWALAARSPAVVAAAFPIAGMLPPKLHPARAPADAPRVVAFHGEADQLVEFGYDLSTQARFEQVGFAATLRRYPGLGHAPAAPLLSDVRQELVRAIRDQGCAR
jgi:phospholipase/carboxylesterase